MLVRFGRTMSHGFGTHLCHRIAKCSLAVRLLIGGTAFECLACLGRKEGFRRLPHQPFDPEFYLAAYPDVKAAGIDPFEHWMQWGRREGRIGAPQLVPEESLADLDPHQENAPLPHQPFDPEFYLAAYPDVKAAGIDPFEHWMQWGRREGRIGAPQLVPEESLADLDPHQENAPLPHQPFDPKFYLAAYPDVKAAGIDPFEHWMQWGRREGRIGAPQLVPEESLADLDPHQENAPLPHQPFDPEFYLAAYPDVKAAGIDPFEHWMQWGRREGRIGAPQLVPEESLADLDPHQENAPLPHQPFDPEFYLAAYPDLEAAGVDPFEHWMQWGRREGRIGAPQLVFEGNLADLDPKKKTILVVSHEASRTGAPILCLNVITHLAKQYNIISLLLSGGPIVDEFTKRSCLTVYSAIISPNAGGFIANKILSMVKLDFALVNSAVSYSVSETLARELIPSIFLLHEFASYINPIGIIENIIHWSTEVVYSSHIILDDSMHCLPYWLPRRQPHVVPQGRCIPPAAGNVSLAEAKKIRAAFRPTTCPLGTRVVLGAGSVHIRKGIDLFLQCAALILERSHNRNIRFVWIGSGYRPKDDMGYSIYLAQQVRRSGIENHVVFLDEVASIDVAYQEADLFLLTSRLDPLPNVGIDSVTQGLPILCFDNASGIADILKEEELQFECVAPHLNVDAMADLAVNILDYPVHAEHLKVRLQDIGRRRFAMERYVLDIDQLINVATVNAMQEDKDERTILDSGHFDLSYWNAGRARPQGLSIAIKTFVRGWASGVCRRKPFPSFHPGVYARYVLQQDILNCDPFAHYLRAGEPEGPWIAEVIQPLRQKKPVVGKSVALHIHVIDVDEVRPIISSLHTNVQPVDLFISLEIEALREVVMHIFADYVGGICKILITPSQYTGAPSLEIETILHMANEYDFIGRIVACSKSSATSNEVRLSTASVRCLAGGEASMVDAIVMGMDEDPNIGLVLADSPKI